MDFCVSLNLCIIIFEFFVRLLVVKDTVVGIITFVEKRQLFLLFSDRVFFSTECLGLLFSVSEWAVLFNSNREG